MVTYFDLGPVIYQHFFHLSAQLIYTWGPLNGNGVMGSKCHESKALVMGLVGFVPGWIHVG